MEKHFDIEEIVSKLNDLKSKPYDSKSFETLIEIVEFQNKRIQVLSSDLNKVQELQEESMKLITKGTNSTNSALETIFNWMNAQNERNESVDLVYRDIINRIQKLE